MHIATAIRAGVLIVAVLMLGACGSGATDAIDDVSVPEVGPRHVRGTGVFVVERGRRRVVQIGPGSQHPVWSPDGRWIAYSRGMASFWRPLHNGPLTITSSDGRRTRQLTSEDAAPIGFSADSGTIFYLAAGTLHAVDRTTRADQEIAELARDDEQISRASISPSGRKLLFDVAGRYGDGTSDIKIIDLDGAEERTLTTGCLPTWSPDGRRIAFIREQGDKDGVYVMSSNGANERLVAKLELSSPCGDAPSYSPDGRSIAIAGSVGYDTRVLIVDVRSRRVRKLVASDYQSDPAWSPDGRWIAFADFNGIRVAGVRGRPFVQLTTPPADFDDCTGYADYGATWSPDSSRVAFTRGTTAQCLP